MDRFESAYEKLDDLDKKKNTYDADDFEEFMRKVEEVNKMVHALASGDKAQVEEATKSADAWLANRKSEKSFSDENEKETVEEVVSDPSQRQQPKKAKKSCIYYKKEEAEKPKASDDLGNLNSETMSQEEFMRSVEEDAKKRSEERKKRIIESDAIKAKAKKAFRENNFEKALDLYNKAIDVRKDSFLLYVNRALTLLTLGLYTRALKDAETALRLEENSFKARLYKWHALYGMGEDEQAQKCLDEFKMDFGHKLQEITKYEEKVRNEESDET